MEARAGLLDCLSFDALAERFLSKGFFFFSAFWSCGMRKSFFERPGRMISNNIPRISFLRAVTHTFTGFPTSCFLIEPKLRDLLKRLKDFDNGVPFSTATVFTSTVRSAMVSFRECDLEGSAASTASGPA